VLRHAGVAAAPYHAGLEHAVRRSVQRDFLTDRLDCVVATSAFGMGIDKANVRAVVHLGLSTSLEAYYQEAGRAGRDGRRAYCVMLWSRPDVRLARRIVRERWKLEPLLRYISALTCRRKVLLRHFGKPGARCGGCDRCAAWRRLWKGGRAAA
jgi:ATP-dependent DNA helicase RecQ